MNREVAEWIRRRVADDTSRRPRQTDFGRFERLAVGAVGNGADKIGVCCSVTGKRASGGEPTGGRDQQRERKNSPQCRTDDHRNSSEFEPAIAPVRGWL